MKHLCLLALAGPLLAASLQSAEHGSTFPGGPASKSPSSPHARETRVRPSVGAIRWDAWTGGRITEEVQRTLGPAHYHDRLPWFAEVTSDHEVRIDGGRQEIMDREITFAADAGLNYWAFLLYPASSPMSHALGQYLKSTQRHRLQFCVIIHGTLGVPESAWPDERARLVALLKEPDYQTVFEGRPLVFEFQSRLGGKFPQQRFDDFRRAAREAGLNPYFVFMGWNPQADFSRAAGMGFDAVSAYAMSSDAPTFAALARKVESDYWQKAASAKAPYIPLVTTGWDKRPRKEHPVSWEKDHAYHRQAVFPTTATPAEIASHLERAVGFVQQNPEVCRANALLFYAWNEHDEGGWLSPTWTTTGRPNTARLDAIRAVLRTAREDEGRLADQSAAPKAEPGTSTQYILFNRAPGQGMYQGNPSSLGTNQFADVLTHFPNRPGSRIQTGLSYVFSPFRTPPEKTLPALQTFLHAAAQTDTPVVVQIDLEHWWDARPDLWNWWDPAKPGFNSDNRFNVEWSGWSPEDALKIAWRNWGRQIRVLPPPNLASPRYTAACREEIRRLVPVVMSWHASLPNEKKHLLVGIKLGHETSIGVNAYHYPGGNELIGRPASEDPVHGLRNEDVLARGVAQIGYAALKSSGLRATGKPTESELRDVAQRYLELLCREAAAAGVPRRQLFTHGAGWKDGELIYDAPMNQHACPGWSFYKHAADPRKDQGVQRNLARSDAPYWAAAEWLLQGKRDTTAWRNALSNTLSDPGCRYVCIFNWESIQMNEAAHEAIRSLVETGMSRPRLQAD